MLLNAEYKNDFESLKTKINKNKLIYLDNAATSLKPRQIVKKLDEYYNYNNSNVHRANHTLAAKATKMYDDSRIVVKDFINANSEKEVIFTKGTTESLNLLAYSLFFSKMIKNDEELLIPVTEHHANFVPWQQLSKYLNIKINYYFPSNGIFNSEEFIKLITNKTKIISLSGLLNVTGQLIEIDSLIKKIRNINKNVIIIIDGAQYVPHIKTDVQRLDVDFLAFSGHKMLAPMGIGILYGKENILNKMNPFLFGGEMINKVEIEKTTFNHLPFKFEAGTPNVGGAIALAEAIKYLNNIGMENVFNHTKQLTQYALEKMQNLEFIDIYGTKDKNHYSIVSFNMKNTHPHDVSHLLNDLKGIAIRSGHHCAQLFMKQLNVQSTCRASFYVYNTFEDVDKLIEGLIKIKGWLK